MSFRVHERVQALPGLTCSPEQTPPAALVNPTWKEQGSTSFQRAPKASGTVPTPNPAQLQGLEEETVVWLFIGTGGVVASQ